MAYTDVVMIDIPTNPAGSNTSPTRPHTEEANAEQLPYGQLTTV